MCSFTLDLCICWTKVRFIGVQLLQCAIAFSHLYRNSVSHSLREELKSNTIGRSYMPDPGIYNTFSLKIPSILIHSTILCVSLTSVHFPPEVCILTLCVSGYLTQAISNAWDSNHYHLPLCPSLNVFYRFFADQNVVMHYLVDVGK